ncbi:HAMP domain-containing sensor histidine kinase [Streptomyces sp. NPDC093228]|uniref:HAMP domain-containing sensor histidine kinase n=1 Tax=Streptomyces sp. NPDC093228 TaxID=3155070 RepID=UPI003443BBB3
MRARATAAVALVAALALAACSVVLLLAVHTNLIDSAQRTARDHMEQAAGQLGSGTSVSEVRAALPDVSVVSETGPGATTTTQAPGNGTSASVDTASGIVLVQAYPNFTPAYTAVVTLAWTLGPCIALLVVLMAFLTWCTMGRALRPVESIRAEFADISAHSLQTRVPVPCSGDEVALLAETMNGTLDQLQHAVGRLGTFTSDASHELRAPLTTLKARLELAMARPDSAAWTAVGREALRDTTQLEEIVADLLLLARLDARQPLKLQPLSLTGLLRQTVADRYPHRPIVLVTDDHPDEDDVLGSRTALARIFTNLLDNGLRHAHSGVTVEIRHSGHELTAEVWDDGPGIEEADRERVFDRFTRLDNARTRTAGGTGLGLAIARDIATAHGGTLTALPPRAGGRGARMALTLPSTASLTHSRQGRATGR